MRVAISLPTGDGFGWGVCGDHLREHLPSYFERTQSDGTPLVVDLPMIHAIQGTNMMPLSMNEWSSVKNVGLCFIEESELVRRYVPNALRYFDHVCAGSTWCADILREAGLKTVSVAIQGVDTAYFCPGDPPPPSDRFTIFSGGKAEWRKGTDIAIKAIGVMMQRHKDVYAVGAWHNPWKHTQDTLRWERGIIGALVDAKIDTRRLLGPIDKATSHRDTLALYRQCDVGLFPNRVEGGTNMVMCEFMACGKPVVATAEHGHLDVVRPDSWFSIKDADMRVSAHADGTSVIPIAKYWEADLDEVVEALEMAYRNRGIFELDGKWNRQHVSQFTWDGCAQSLLEACK